MIATLEGKITELDDNQLVLEIGGIGYGIILTNTDISRTNLHSAVKLYIYEHIKEDQHGLIGFYSKGTKKLFEQLLSVKNVGPKVALSILDIGDENSVKAAISGGDIKSLQSAKGVGKRAAEQIVVELRDKVGMVSSNEADEVIGRAGINQGDPAVQALTALGYSDFDAQRALVGVPQDKSVEERVKLALKSG
jgi:Holliday junction DNA helicase RuvA